MEVQCSGSEHPASAQQLRARAPHQLSHRAAPHRTAAGEPPPAHHAAARANQLLSPAPSRGSAAGRRRKAAADTTEDREHGSKPDQEVGPRTTFAGVTVIIRIEYKVRIESDILE